MCDFFISKPYTTNVLIFSILKIKQKSALDASVVLFIVICSDGLHITLNIGSKYKTLV